MSTTAVARESRWLRGPLRPFRAGQYRLLCGSVALAMLAGGMWLIALVWQVIALGGGAVQLSYASTAGAVGMIGASLVGGVFADRVPQRQILLAVAGVRAAGVAVVAGLASVDVLTPWHLAVVAFVVGAGNGFSYPAYSALLPAVVPTDDLMAANGLEGTMRPTVMQAAGPALASLVIGASSPAAAFGIAAALEVAGVVCLLVLRPLPLRRDLDAQHGVTAVLVDLREGCRYVTRTPWLLATLLFASVMVLVVIGPIEVLVPFVLKNRAGGGPGDHALVMAAFGIGGAVGSLGMTMVRMPRRYLTLMMLMWGGGCLPLTVLGFATNVWVMAAAVFAVGVLFSAPMVIWGTLLQRRVPPALLGRVSSLDFFVSLAFMPLSMALAGPVSAAVGLDATFVVAGLVPVLAGTAALLLARLPRDELANPIAAAADQHEPSPGRDWDRVADRVAELPRHEPSPRPCEQLADCQLAA